jgi:hypothetical protein
MTSGTIKNCSTAAFFLTLAVCAIVATHDWHSITGELHGTLVTANGTVGDIAAYVHAEKMRIEDPKNQKAIDAAIQLGAVFNGSGRLLNKEVLPRLWSEIDALHAGTDNLALFVKHSDDSLNRQGVPFLTPPGVLPAAAMTISKFGVTTDALNQAIDQVVSTTGVARDEVLRKMNDPRFGELLDEAVALARKTNATMDQVDGTMTEVHATAGNVETASEQLPDIAASLAKIAKTTSQFSKAYWLSRIISVFLPLVP